MTALIARLRDARRKFDVIADQEPSQSQTISVALFATVVAMPLLDDCHAAFKEREAENERLREALRAIMDMPGEINPSNYDDHDVDALNNAHIETYNICKAALAQKEPVE